MVLPDFSEDSFLLGVFDGHGGMHMFAYYNYAHLYVFVLP